MNIREWFGYKDDYDHASKINVCIDGLLQIYVDAVKVYFSLDHAQNFRDIQNIDRSLLNREKTLFLDWLIEKGFPYLKTIASKHLPDDDNLVAQIDYDKFILEEEMDFEYPEDVRSSLIGIVSDLPIYIQAASEVSVTIDADQIFTWITENDLEKINHSYEETTYYEIKGNEYLVSKYKESAKAGSLYFSRRHIYENYRILQFY